MPHHQNQPDQYRLLAVFSGQPHEPIQALQRSGLAVCHASVTEYARRTLGRLVDEQLIRWVNWTESGAKGYVLTGRGEVQLDHWFALYGPALLADPVGESAAP